MKFPKIFLWLLLLVVVALILIFVRVGLRQSGNELNTNNLESSPTATVPQRTTLEGEVVCLPHRDTSGPHTMECAFGIKADDGNYYALDTNLMSATPPKFNIGERIKASGLMTPIEMLSSDHWQTYNLVGIFSVTDSLEVR